MNIDHFDIAGGEFLSQKQTTDAAETGPVHRWQPDASRPARRLALQPGTRQLSLHRLRGRRGRINDLYAISPSAASITGPHEREMGAAENRRGRSLGRPAGCAQRRGKFPQ